MWPLCAQGGEMHAPSPELSKEVPLDPVQMPSAVLLGPAAAA